METKSTRWTVVYYGDFVVVVPRQLNILSVLFCRQYMFVYREVQRYEVKIVASMSSVVNSPRCSAHVSMGTTPSNRLTSILYDTTFFFYLCERRRGTMESPGADAKRTQHRQVR